tara:strand:- start:9563 stop:11053 length:1491 start_codon:yes stop_codon:yes gene_type:complete
MAKKQMQNPMMMQQQRSKQPRGGSMESMLIQGESGLNETMDNNTQFIANPMMQAVQGIMAKDAAASKNLMKNLEKPFQEVDKVTGEMVRTVSDRKVRGKLIDITRTFKKSLFQSGGKNMDVINGEMGDLERAVEEWNKDKTNFAKNLSGPRTNPDNEPHYSAGTNITTLDNNSIVYGELYDEVNYNSKTRELEWTVSTKEISFDHLGTEEEKRKGRNLQSFVDRGRELTPEQQADYDKLLPKGKKGSRIITQSMLDEGVILKDAKVSESLQGNVQKLVDLGTKGEAVTRDDNNNVMVPGFDLNKMTTDMPTLITMAWDNHLNISGGKTFIEHWKETHQDDDMSWATQGENFKPGLLKDRVIDYYQKKMNKQYENGVNNFRDNTQAGRLSASIDKMIDGGFSPNVDAISSAGGSDNQPVVGQLIGSGDNKMLFDYKSMIADNGNIKMDYNEDDGVFEVLVYNKTTDDYEVKDSFGEDSNIDKFKRAIKIYFGSNTAY